MHHAYFIRAFDREFCRSVSADAVQNHVSRGVQKAQYSHGDDQRVQSKIDRNRCDAQEQMGKVNVFFLIPFFVFFFFIKKIKIS